MPSIYGQVAGHFAPFAGRTIIHERPLPSYHFIFGQDEMMPPCRVTSHRTADKRHRVIDSPAGRTFISRQADVNISRRRRGLTYQREEAGRASAASFTALASCGRTDSGEHGVLFRSPYHHCHTFPRCAQSMPAVTLFAFGDGAAPPMAPRSASRNRPSRQPGIFRRMRAAGAAAPEHATRASAT